MDGHLKVRANHGHGIPGVEVVERELTSEDAITYLVHVTSYETWSLIRYEGYVEEREVIYISWRVHQNMTRWWLVFGREVKSVFTWMWHGR